MQSWPADKVERWSLNRLIPYAKNARTHSEEQVAQIAASIREWGWTTPVLVDEEGGIIAGHGRVLAARKLGLAEVPVMVAAGWTDAQRRAYVLADNKLPENAAWDMDLLRLEVADLAGMGFDATLAGFSGIELDTLLGTPVAAPEDEWKAMPEFAHEDQTSAFRVIVHFKDREALDAFAQAIGQTVTEKTRALWYPPADIGHYADKQYAAGPGDDAGAP